MNLARKQDYTNIRILVSVDKSTDKTLEICRNYAHEDDRVSVFEQTCQLGWTKNTNFLLDQVETPYYAIYFHDDFVEPTWISTLYQLLLSEEGAGAAFCCVRQNTYEDRGEDYKGNTYNRLLRRVLGTNKGSPLRALTRTDIGPVRFPEGVSLMGYNAQLAYLISLISKAPMLYCGQPLYQRWNGRHGGVTDKWRSLDPKVIESDIEVTACAIGNIINECISNKHELKILLYANAKFILRTLLLGKHSNDYRLNLPTTGLFDIKLTNSDRCYLADESPEFFNHLCKLENEVKAKLEHR